jgi:hypothetical protein
MRLSFLLPPKMREGHYFFTTLKCERGEDPSLSSEILPENVLLSLQNGVNNLGILLIFAIFARKFLIVSQYRGLKT